MQYYHKAHTTQEECTYVHAQSKVEGPRRYARMYVYTSKVHLFTYLPSNIHEYMA